jgi:hypothetical protein
MFSWKQRLYAFLIKRLLGPYLTVESQQQLYTRIEQISLTDGSYVFSDLSFDTNFISSKLKQKFVFRIIKAAVRKIQIDIKLQEDAVDDLSQQSEISSEGSSSFAWKAFRFGVNTATNTSAIRGDDTVQEGRPLPSTIALSVQIRLEGIMIVLEPNTDDCFMSEVEPWNDDDGASTSSKSSYLSSFLEAALASVRLSVEILDVRLQLYEASSAITAARQRLLECRIQSLLYYDVRNTGSTSSPHREETLVEQNHTSYETIVHKAVELTRLTVLTGTRSLDDFAGSDPSVACSKSVGLLDGTTRCSLRVIEYRNFPNDGNSVQVPVMQEQPNNATTQSDLQIAMNQKLNLSVDLESLQSIRAVVHSYFTDHSPSKELLHETPPTQSIVAATTLLQRIHRDGTDDDADYRVLEDIMSQYREARLLVEKKEMRGGILVPSIDEGGDVTFDAFFDANEESYLRYSSVLRDSILGSMLYDGSQQQPLADVIRTKFTLHLQEGGIKLSFPAFGKDIHLPNEYVLLTFNDVNLSCQLSSKCTESTFSIQHIELEDGILHKYAHIAKNEVAGLQATQEIQVGTIVRFVPVCDYDDDEDETDLLIEAPCVTISFKVDRKETKDLMNVEVVMEPLEIAYRIATISRLCQLLRTDVQQNPPVIDAIKPKHKTVSLTATCSSVTVLHPWESHLASTNLYQRTGYSAECMLGRDPAVGCCFERLYFELNHMDDIEIQSEISISCCNMVTFVSCPTTRHNAFDYAINRLDFLSVSCQTEADSCVTIALNFTSLVARDISCDNGHCNKTLAQSLFPTAPSLSSFKNRQDDEDDNMATVKPSNIKGDYRNWNSGDPEAVMLSDASICDVVVSINIREIFMDLSVKELKALHEMVSCLKTEEASPSSLQATSDKLVMSKQVAYSVFCDRFSLSLQIDRDTSIVTFEDNMVQCSTFLLTMEQCKGYGIAVGPSPKHLRCSVYDFDFLESKCNFLFTCVTFVELTSMYICSVQCSST